MLAGVDDIIGQREDGAYGAFSGSCELSKDSLSAELREKLDKEGIVILSIPPEDVNLEKLNLKVCQQYSLKEFSENIILLDTGHVKLMTPFYPLDKLRKIKGLERARYEDPYSGGKGNSIRYLSIAPRDNALKVEGVDNLLCAGEKAGLFVGHTEAISTGSLAGHNSVRLILGMPLLVLPRNTVIGDIIAYANEEIKTREGLKKRYTFSGSVFFDRMKKMGTYIIDNDKIKEKMQRLNLLNIYNDRLI